MSIGHGVTTARVEDMIAGLEGGVYEEMSMDIRGPTIMDALLRPQLREEF